MTGHNSILINLFLILSLGLTLVACDSNSAAAVRLPPTPTATVVSPSTKESTMNGGQDQVSSVPAQTDEALAKTDLEAGSRLFGEVCAPCHNQKGTGIEGIGVDLTQSQFVARLTTTQLAEFIKMGRGLNSPFNRSGVKMPPKGGRPDLTDNDALNIAVYVQDLNAKSNTAQAYLDWLAKGGAEEIEPEIEVNRAGLSGVALDGQTTFLRFCAVCHGPHGEGVESLGKNLIESDFVAGLSDKELVQFITEGRSVDDPLNATGIQMLPYGGQPSLSETELTNLVAYIRAINIKDAPPQVTAAKLGDETVNADEAWAIIDRANPQCLTCHRIADRGNDGPGPRLNGLAEVVGDYVPGQSAEEYIRQSILEPTAFLTPECPTGPCLNVMPNTYGESLTEAEINILVKFILSLPPDQ